MMVREWMHLGLWVSAYNLALEALENVDGSGSRRRDEWGL